MALENTSTGEATTARRGRLVIIILCAITMAVYASFITVAVTHTHDRIGLGAAPLGYDFSVFYQAASFADMGKAADAYDDSRIIGAVQQAFPGSTLRLPWNYPPTFQMLLMPLGALPYMAAWIAWSVLLYGLYAFVMHRLVRRAEHLWLVLLAPGAAVNLFFGQNGLLTVILMGGGTLMLGRRPALAGVLLGLLAYKPQFALLAPIVLVAGREWRALVWAIISEMVLALLAAIILGDGPWLAFLHKAAQPAVVFSSSSSNWRAIPSVMVLARTLGFGALASSICHWLVAAAAAAGALWIWQKSRDAEIRVAALATATLLVTPYLRGYDLILMALSIIPLMNKPKRTIIERTVMILAWIIPAVLMFGSSQIQFAPFVTIALMIVLGFLYRADTVGTFKALCGVDGATPNSAGAGSRYH